MMVGTDRIQNYGNANYGTQTLASMTHISANTGFIRLVQSMGVDKVIDVAERMGVKTPLKEIVSITLGGSEVTTVDMATVYGTIANGGIRRDPISIEVIYDQNNNEILRADTSGERAISPEVAHAATEVLKGVITGGTGTGAQLATAQPVAGKTGTSNDARDRWFCGITPYYSVSIALGKRVGVMNSEPSPDSAFAEFMNAALADKPIRDFPEADDPDYESYSDPENGINGRSYGDSSDNGDNDKPDEPTDKPDEPTTTDPGTTDPAPVDPVDPVDPDPVEPVEPVEPIDPPEPVDPPDPGGGGDGGGTQGASTTLPARYFSPVMERAWSREFELVQIGSFGRSTYYQPVVYW